MHISIHVFLLPLRCLDESDYESDGSSSGDDGPKEQAVDTNRFAYSEEP